MLLWILSCSHGFRDPVVLVEATSPEGNNSATTTIVDKVIISLPIGVLKKVTAEGFFKHPLSVRKATAIEKWGVGRFGWVFLAFPYAFWPHAELNGYGFLFDEKNHFNNTDEELEAGEDWMQALYSASTAPNRYELNQCIRH